ncbi:5289_t:CDS:2 [Funneliformis geosporum]|uniref:15683_t:CDS:1 n=1 Tax=Funneliformis geosporum TaxID=1117311 RepID=A0A9W4T001_9GLOM|nr:5289_t:CDS:2 [Funneliformis geosporum]CAI2186790.1 15683_t:CDS:2 [Funneliformis geosporum]
MPLFDLETDDQIREFMQNEGKKHYKPYVEMSRRLPKFTPKQICHRWNYKLNPRLTDGPFTQEEKEFIYKWVTKNIKESGEIRWSHCQKLMEKKFKKFRAVNRIQGMWLTHRRHLERGVKKTKIPGTNTIDLSHVKQHTTIVFNPSYTTLVFSDVPILRTRPRLPTLIPSFQPEIKIPKMMPLF